MIHSDPQTRADCWETGEIKLFSCWTVSAASGHKEICCKLLSLKEILSADQIREVLISYNGFLHRAMWDAILFQNVPMFQVTLEAVNQVLGQDDLLVLLKSSNPGPVNNNNHSLAKYDIHLFKIIGKILLQNGKKKGYEGLNDLDLHTDPCLNSMANIEKTIEILDDETLTGILTLKGLENWTKWAWLGDFVSYRIIFLPDLRADNARDLSTQSLQPTHRSFLLIR